MELGSPISSIACSPDKTRFRIALGLAEGGGKMIWDDIASGQENVFSTDMDELVLGINRGGFLVSANAHCAEVYSTSNDELKLIATTVDLPQTPVSILSCLDARFFAICGSSGDIRYYDVLQTR